MHPLTLNFRPIILPWSLKTGTSVRDRMPLLDFHGRNETPVAFLDSTGLVQGKTFGTLTRRRLRKQFGPKPIGAEVPSTSGGADDIGVITPYHHNLDLGNVLSGVKNTGS